MKFHVSAVLIERFLCVSVLTGAFRESRRRRRMLNEKHRPDKWPLGKSRLRAFAIQKLLAAICCVGSQCLSFFLSLLSEPASFSVLTDQVHAGRPVARSLVVGAACHINAAQLILRHQSAYIKS
jgi:ABC-type Fe3+ transport system permease subunit